MPMQWSNQENSDNYYLAICDSIAKFCKCHSRKIGCVFVKDEIIIPAYNGPPRGIPHCEERLEGIFQDLRDDILSNKYVNALSFYNDGVRCPRKLRGYKSGEGLGLCISGHAERNALLNCARKGISTLGGTLYMNCTFPCKDCMIEIIQAGIKEIIYTEEEKYYDYELSKWLAEEAKIITRGITRCLNTTVK